jgi:NhaP-type Na+/H+ or K+/H+ antiporter
MEFAIWFVIIGSLLVVIALAGSVLKRLPLTTSMFYLAVGAALGPAGWGLMNLDPALHAPLLERIAEVAVLISLFTAGLKLRIPFQDRRWVVPVRLAFVSMAVTVGLIAVVGVLGLGLSWGAAVLLGAILAPTDPVLASDVQVTSPADRDRLRFGLTGEAGMNDGTAFPFVMLGLGLMGYHELGAWGWRWLLVDGVWAVGAGLGLGWLLGTAVGHLVVYLRREHKEATGLDDFLALGLIALAYGVALLIHAYGFLAVFAAGLALRRVEARAAGGAAPEDVRAAAAAGHPQEVATHPEKAPAYMVEAVLGFNEHVERIGEVTAVVLLGGLLATTVLTPEALWFVPLLLLGIRPVSVLAGLAGTRTSPLQRGLMGWFGIRGIGSLYYLMFAIHLVGPKHFPPLLVSLTLITVAVSIVVHGISVTPLMNVYARRRERRQAGPGTSAAENPEPARA